MLADPHNGPQDNGQNGDLNGEERARPSDMPGNLRHIDPAGYEHQKESREHEPQSGQHATHAAACHNTEMHAEFMGFRSRQHLQDCQQPIEPCAIEPVLFLHKGLSQHRDLRNRPSISEASEAQEFQEQTWQGDMRKVVGFESGIHKRSFAAGAAMERTWTKAV